MPNASHSPLALVTGANRGIGFEVCRLLAAGGFRVLLTARDRSAGAEAAAKLATRGLAVAFRPLDVADPESIAAFTRSLEDEGSPPAMLVNNAGVALKGFNGEVVRRTMAVNLFGVMALTDALLPLMARPGRIVMVSSEMGALSGFPANLRAEFTAAALTREGLTELVTRFRQQVEAGTHREHGWPGSAYNVSKAALNAYTRLLARELAGGGLSVSAVCPGWVRTRMGGRMAPRGVAKGADTIAWAAQLPPEAHHGSYLKDRKPIGW